VSAAMPRPMARKASGLSVAAHQRGANRQRTIRLARSARPTRPEIKPETTIAASAGPARAGEAVGQPTPRRTMAPLATNVKLHPQEIA